MYGIRKYDNVAEVRLSKPPEVVTVARVTATLIVVEGGRRYSKKTGLRVGYGKYGFIEKPKEVTDGKS